MDYTKHYNLLMKRAPTTKPKTGYYERHRIVPGCMGGKYVVGNIAWLTAEEHYLAHQLLVKIYPQNGKLIYALRMLTRKSIGQIRNNKEYGWIRRTVNRQLSINLFGKAKPIGHGANVSVATIEHHRSGAMIKAYKQISVAKKGILASCVICHRSGNYSAMLPHHFKNCHYGAL